MTSRSLNLVKIQTLGSEGQNSYMDVIKGQAEDDPGTVDFVIQKVSGDQEKGYTVATDPSKIRGESEKLILESTSEDNLSFSIDEKA